MSIAHKIIENINLKEDDTIVFTGNLVKILAIEKSKNIEKFLNDFIDKLQLKLKNGTIAFQTFNWDFCKGKDFNIRTTPSKTGILGNIALKRKDFKRTKHPIYSFAVWGKYQKELINLNNKSSFGEDSPFAFFKNKNAKMIIIDMPLQTSFTFVHYVEEIEKVNYRYQKNFKAYYIDENNNKTLREYSMYVRNLEKGVETYLYPLENLLLDKGAMKKINIEGIEIININLAKSYQIIKEDIKFNKARNIHKEKNV